jgi:hypothetical protein
MARLQAVLVLATWLEDLLRKMAANGIPLPGALRIWLLGGSIIDEREGLFIPNGMGCYVRDYDSWITSTSVT